MAAQPYELLARFNPDGRVRGVSVRTLTVVDGRTFESDPAPLSGIDDPVFTQFAVTFAAQAVSERDALLAERDALRLQLAAVVGHPDVVAAKKASDIAEAVKSKEDAQRAIVDADKKIAELGE